MRALGVWQYCSLVWCDPVTHNLRARRNTCDRSTAASAVDLDSPFWPSGLEREFVQCTWATGAVRACAAFNLHIVCDAYAYDHEVTLRPAFRCTPHCIATAPRPVTSPSPAGDLTGADRPCGVSRLDGNSPGVAQRLQQSKDEPLFASAHLDAHNPALAGINASPRVGSAQDICLHADWIPSQWQEEGLGWVRASGCCVCHHAWRLLERHTCCPDTSGAYICKR